MGTDTTFFADRTSARNRPAAGPTGPLLLAGLLFPALVLLGDQLLGDPDTQWHVAIGTRIWLERAVPWIDRDTHTFAGAPWIAKEWLSQVLLSAAHRVAGWTGTVVLAAATLATVFAALFGWLARRLRGSLALAVTLGAVIFVAPHFLARPHVFALAALLAWTVGLVAAAERGRAPSPVLLLVLVLWANLHGSFTIAYPLAGLLAAEAVLLAPAGHRLTVAARWGLFGAGALAAGCVTPYGLHAMAVTATLFGSGEPLPFVTEWQPLAFDATGIAALASAALIMGALAAEPGRNAFRLLTVAGLTVMMLRHSRFLDIYALVAPVLAAGPVLRLWPALGPERPSGLRLAPTVRGAAFAALGALALALVITAQPRPPATVAPAAALAEARRIGASGPVYNDYDFGGFLLAQGIRTFIDGRTDQLFLGGFISSLYRAVRAEDGQPFLDLLSRHGVTWALVKPASPETRHLERAGWRRAYADEAAALYLRG